MRCQVCTGCGLCPGISWGTQQNREFEVLADGCMEAVVTDGGEHNQTYVAAADIGTTTIAMVLRDTAGREVDRFLAVNPQRQYGADVISRIQKAENSSNAEHMRQQVLGVLSEGLARFQKKCENNPLLLVVAANTTETYLLMGWDPSELGRAPFWVRHREAVRTTLLGVDAYILPRLSAFVGGDIVAGIVAAGIDREAQMTLFVDLGTNGEMVLGNREGMLACATAAGPAFEGGANVAVWGADMVSALAELRRNRFVDETGLLAEKYFQSGVRVGNVLVRQEAVRALQLAKGAIAAGIDTLTDRMGVKMTQIHRIILAGGFGYYLKPADAAAIGLLPASLEERTIAGGNTSLMGAGMTAYDLLNRGEEALRKKWEALSGTCHCINLAADPSFEERYLGHLALEPYR